MAYNEIRNRKGYSKEQLEWLKENHPKYKYYWELAQKYNETFNENRSVNAIKHRCSDTRYMGLKSNIKFTKEEDEFIKNYAPKTTRKELYKLFCDKFDSKKTFLSVNKRAKYIKALRTKETISRARYQNMADKYPIGYRLRHKNMEYIKIKNEPIKKGESALKNYIPYHRYILKQNGIELSENQTVKFKDGNLHNCNLDNLLIVSTSTMGFMIKYNLWNKGEITETALKLCELNDEIRKLSE